MLQDFIINSLIRRCFLQETPEMLTSCFADCLRNSEFAFSFLSALALCCLLISVLVSCVHVHWRCSGKSQVKSFNIMLGQEHSLRLPFSCDLELFDVTPSVQGLIPLNTKTSPVLHHLKDFSRLWFTNKIRWGEFSDLSIPLCLQKNSILASSVLFTNSWVGKGIEI